MAAERLRTSCAVPGGWSRRLMVCALATFLAWPALAQAPGSSPTKPVIDELEVPASQPDLWPPGIWQPVLREGYREFLADFERPADAAPAPVPILESLTLDATLAADSLIGTFTGEVTLPEGSPAEGGNDGVKTTPRVLDLSGTELALSSLQWGDEPAVWGVGPEDRLLVVTAPPERRLVGKWSLRGSAVFDALEFRVVGLPALASRIRLTLPAAWSITSDCPVQSSPVTNAAVLNGAAPAVSARAAVPAGGIDQSRIWTIDLGHRRRTRLTVHRPGLRTAQAGQLACESDTVFSVTRGGGGLDSVTDLRLLGNPATPLELDVPRELHITSAVLGEIPIRFRREPGETSDRVILDIPSLEGETGASLRIRATQPVRWGGKPVSAGEIQLRSAPLLRKGVTLQIDRPMELQSLEVSGLEQTDVSADGVRETYVFSATARETSLKISVSEPEVRLTTDCWVLADLRGENPVVWQVWSLQSAAGETYRLDVPVPEPWEVVHVAPAGETPESALSQWNFEKKGTQGGLLSVEFRRGLTPQTPKRILLELRGQPILASPGPLPPAAGKAAANAASMVLPILVPPFSRDVTTSAAIWVPDGMEPRHSVNSAWKKGTVEDLPAAFFQLGGTLVRNLNFDQAEYLTAETRRGPPDLKIEPRRPQVIESLELRPPVTPRNQPQTSGSGEVGPIATRLEVTTLLGAPGAADHIHTALFQFSGAIRLADLAMTLPGGLRPVSIQDDRGEIAFAVNEGRLIFGEPQRQATSLRFEYRTAAGPGWLLATEQVAFPQLEGFQGPFVWRIDLSGRRAFLDTDLPWSTVAAEQVSPRWWQILGPIARRRGERIFNPLRRDDWRALVLPDPDEWREAEEVLHISPSVPPQVTLRTYLVPRMRTLAWAFFLGCLLLGAFARRARLRLVRQVGYYSMALFVPLAWFLPPLYGIQMGAIASGLTLIYLIPRSIVVRDQFWRPRILPRPDKLRAAGVATATGLIAAASIFGAQEASSTGPAAAGRQWLVLVPTEDGQRQSHVLLDPPAFEAFSLWKRHASLPSYLLEAAQYSVTDDGGRLSGKAEIELTLIETTLPVTVRLPFDHVTLDAGASCHVDGRPVRVRPAADGKSILVPFIPEATNPAPAENLPARPAPFRRSKIVLDFVPRTDLAQPQRIDLVVPAAGDTRFTFRSNNLDPTAPQVTIDSRAGAVAGAGGGGPVRTPEPGTWITSLGARGNLSVSWSRPAALASPRGLLAQSLVTLSPLSADVQTRIEFPPASPSTAGDGADRSLLIPAAAVVDSVTGTALERYQIAAAAVSGERRIDVRFASRPEHESAFVDIRFRLPFDATAERPALPPLVRVGALPFQHHRIGFVTRGMPPLAPVARPDESTTSLPIHEFTQRQPDELIWPVPEYCVDQSQPNAISFTQSTGGLPRSARIRQGLVVDRTQTRWTGLMSLQPRRSPLLSHELLLDPRVTISSLSVEQDGAERLVRSLRQGDRLTLFVRSRTLDPLTIRAEGTLSGDRLNWSAPPVFGLVDGETQSSDVTVRNESGWLLEIEEAGLAASGAATQADSSPRPVVIDLQTLQPARFRLRPGPDAADAEMWVRVVPWGTDGQGGGQIGVTWHYSFTPVDGPLHIVTGRLPASIASHVVSSSVPIKPENTAVDVPTPFSLSPSPQTPQHNELTIQAILPTPPPGATWEIPEPTFDSARVTRRRLIAGKSWPWVPSAGSATTVADLRPPDLPAAWRSAVRPADYEAYVGRGSAWQFEPRGEALPAGRARTPLVEAIVWQKSGEPLRGRTRIVAVTEHGGPVRIEVPPGLRITSLQRRGTIRTIPSGEGESEGPLVVRVDPARSPEEIIVEWTGDVPEAKPRLDVPRPAAQENVLIAVVPAREQVSVFESGKGTSEHLDPLSGGLAHFANLLEVVRQQRTRAWSLDDPLLESLRRMKQRLEETIYSPGNDVTAAASARYEGLTREWKELQQTLPVNAPSPLSPPGVLALRASVERDLMTELLMADPQVQVGEFFKVGPTEPAVAVKRSSSRRAIELALVVSTGVALLLLLRRLDRLQRRWETAEWVAGHAFLAMMGLGILWWLALSPSAMGAAILAATGLVKLLHIAGHRRAARQAEESTIIASPAPEA